MKKISLIIFVCLICLQLKNDAKNSRENRKNIDSIIVIGSPLGRSYPRTVDCDELLNGGYELFKFNMMIYKRRISRDILKCVSDSNAYNYIDARAKMYIRYNSRTIDTFCFTSDEFFLLNGMGMRLLDRDILKLIDSLINKKIEAY